ncbi:hypothetical protein [Streptomyces sp. NPDC047453]|uniref:hypothetical protein n=1 Tax=Streptomyces sp. NPDC047453 TaxID=3154812 RepID=UPI0033DE207E
MDVIERVADGLRISGHMVGLARRPWETPADLTAAERQPPRREEPQHEAAPTALPGLDADSFLALTSRARPSPSTLKALRASIEDYWRRDDQHGGEALRPAVVDQLRYVVELIKDDRHKPIQHEL